ncbi:MAG: hypothetical protein ACOCWH_00655 [Spirochaetota bacterium]
MRRRIIYSLSLLIISCTMLTAAGEQFSWWLKRIENLRHEKQLLSSRDGYTLLAPVIDEDIRRTSELVSYIQDVVTGRTRHRAHTGEDYLAQTVDASLAGAFALEYTRHITGQLSGKPLLEKSGAYRTKAEDEIVRTHFQDADSDTVRKIRSGLVNTGTASAFNHELLLQTLLDGEKPLREDFMNRYDAVLLEKHRDSSVSVTRIQQDAITLARDESRTWSDAFTIDPSLTQSAAVWKDILYLLDKRCAGISAVRDLLQSAGSEASLQRALYFYTYPARLEEELFPSSGTSPSPYISHIKGSLAQARRTSFRQIDSPKPDTTLKTVLADFTAAAESAQQRYDLSQEESRTVHALSTLSQAYITLIHSLSQYDRAAAERNISYRMERFAQYADRLEKLYLQTYRLSHRVLTEADTGIAALTNTLADELTYLGYNATILPEYRQALEAQRIRSLMQLRSDTHSRISNSARSIRDAYAAYKSEAANFERQLAVKRKEAAGEIAGTELSVLHDTVLSYFEAYSALTSDTAFLSQYRHTFDRYREKLANGQLPEKIETVTGKKSLLALFPEDAIRRLDAERSAKEYLAAAMKRDIVRFNKLKEQYKSAGITPENCPPSSELYAIQEKTTSRTETTVSGWTLHAGNVREVDRKAAYLLTTLYRKNRWEGRYSGGDVRTVAARQISIRGTVLTIAIPDGWKEKSTASDGAHTFTSEYDGSTFTVTVLDNTTEKDAVHGWLTDNNLTGIQLGWDEYDDRLYYWNIARGKNDSLSKIYAYTVDGETVLLCGTAEEKRYPFFHNKIDTVFRSIRN